MPSRHLGVVDNRDEGDVESPVGDRRLEGAVQRGIRSDGREDVEVADDRLPFEADVEHALARAGRVNFGGVEGDRIGQIGDRNVVGEVAVSLGQKQRVVDASLTTITSSRNSLSLRALVRWALLRAALVITHSQVLQRRVVALGVPESRTAVIPNGVDVKQFRPIDRETARACLGIPSSARLILAVGRLHRSKGLATLVDALGQIAHEDPELRLVILGDSDPEADATPDIRTAIAPSGLQGHVTLVGGRSPKDLVWWRNAADLVCVAAAGAFGAAEADFVHRSCGLFSPEPSPPGSGHRVNDRPEDVWPVVLT